MIDCKNTITYAKERRRMCETFSRISDCDDCPLHLAAGCSVDNMLADPIEIVEIVQAWSDKNRI